MTRDFQDDSETLLSQFGIEVRQTLHTMMGWIELTAAEPLSPTQAERMAQCRNSADRLFRISNDFVELASPFQAAAGRAFELRAMVEEVAGITRLLASRKDLQFDCVVDPSASVWVVSDREAVQDMLRRILDNSVRFAGEGIVTLTVKANGLTENSATVVFEIFDTGPGIPQEALSEFQAPAGSSPCRGLGLEIVRRRVLAMKGELTSISSAFPGMRISLPMQLEAGKPVSTGGSGGCATPGKIPALRLLVAEDSDDGFAVLQAYVKEEGHRISRAWNGAEAVEMAQSEPYDMILMDVQMPVVDGYTATRLIREWETAQRLRRTPIVLLSAESAARQMRIGASVGCSGYLTKPATKSQILQALHFYGSQSPADPGSVR